MRQALGFLTPLGGSTRPTAAALKWFPIVGAGVGLAVGAVWWGAARLWPAAVAGALAVLADLVLTGMLHVDGLADAADALFPPVSRERRLEIMRDPRSGAFGVVAVVITMLLRFSVFASITPTGRTPLVVAALWCASRTVMAVTASTVPYARREGLATAFLGASAVPILVIGAVLATVLAVAGADPAARGVLALAGSVVGGVAVVMFARSRIGGFTGDVLGAAGVIGETAGLLVLAVHS